MFARKLLSALAIASFFATAPALAGNRDGFEPERATPQEKQNCVPPAAKSGVGGSGDERRTTILEAVDERSTTRFGADDLYNRSMDAGG